MDKNNDLERETDSSKAFEAVCNPSQLSVLSYANYFTLWHYKTPSESIEMPHYFDNVSDILRENDMIIATTDMTGAPQTDFYTVLAKTREHVVVSRINMGGDGQQGEEFPNMSFMKAPFSPIPQINSSLDATRPH